MEAEEIVRKLAAEDAPIHEGCCGFCEFCGSDGGWPERAVGQLWEPENPERHEPDCPWRLAREWVAAHPAHGGD